MSELAKRTAFAVVAIPVSGFLILKGGLALAGLLAFVSSMAAWEFYRLARATNVRAFDRAGVVLAGLVPLIVHTNFAGYTAIPIAAAAMVFLIVFASAMWFRLGDRPMAAVSITIFGVLYTGGLMSFGYATRHHRFVIDDVAGMVLMGAPLVLTWATEIGGYSLGKMYGKTKLMPKVSPGKTILGSAAGVVLALGAAWAYTVFVLRPYAHLTLTPVGIVVLALVVSAAAQIGDLAESMLKREAGVKDSSAIIPGHGGVLDRLDAILFAIPVSYVLIGELAQAVV